MKVLNFLPLLVLVASCNQAGTATGRPVDPVKDKVVAKNEPMQVHPVTDDVAKEKAEVKADPVKETAPVATGSTKIDPEMLGEYRFVISAVQQESYDRSIAKLKADVAAGNKQSESMLSMAETAYEAAKKMVVTLAKGGTYHANFGSETADGTFKANGDKVILKPNIPSTDPSAPKDVELAFDKKARTLTADFQGEKMVFVKN